MESVNLVQNASDIYHCPYNASHTMPHKRVLAHLQKCPDKHLSKNQNLVQCIHNCTHIIDKSEKTAHEMICSERIAADQLLYESVDTVRPSNFVTQAPVIVDDSWDEPVPVNPHKQNIIQQIVEKPCFLKPTHGRTKSERNKIRSEVRLENIDLSYNKNMTVHERREASTNQTGFRDPENPMFFGRRLKNNK